MKGDQCFDRISCAAIGNTNQFWFKATHRECMRATHSLQLLPVISIFFVDSNLPLTSIVVSLSLYSVCDSYVAAAEEVYPLQQQVSTVSIIEATTTGTVVPNLETDTYSLT